LVPPGAPGPARGAELAGGVASTDLRDLSVGREDHEALLPRIWELRHNATAYDAAYFALAEALGATLLTADRKMAGVPGVTAKVEVID
jgi:predicted nucleic acid-binding protein